MMLPRENWMLSLGNDLSGEFSSHSVDCTGKAVCNTIPAHSGQVDRRLCAKVINKNSGKF